MRTNTLFPITTLLLSHAMLVSSDRQLPASRSLRMFLSHQCQQLLDMSDRGIRQNAMAEVENMRSVLKRPTNTPNPLDERSAAGDERKRIKIALDRQTRR